MPFSLITGLVVLTVVAFIALLLWLYIRSRQGDQHVIDTVNSMLLPILSALIVMTSLLLHNRKTTAACNGLVNTVFVSGIMFAVIVILTGGLYFFIKRRRDRRHITHAILFATMILAATLLYIYLNGCL
jgi:cytochrome bd-type quinol oxidase subunit 2